jgi:hypothetical protein
MRALLTALPLLAPLAHAETVDRVVAVVETELVLLSDLRLDAALSPVDAGALPFWREARPLPEDKLIDAAMLRVLAGDLALYQPQDEAVRERLRGVRAAFEAPSAWPAFLEAHGLTEEALAEVLRRRMVVERVLQRNLTANPADPVAWWAELEDFLGGVRARTRVRRVEEQP